jgi:hypothetical protein
MALSLKEHLEKLFQKVDASLAFDKESSRPDGGLEVAATIRSSTMEDRWGSAMKANSKVCHVSTIPCRFPATMSLESRYHLGIDLLKICCRFPLGRVGIIEVGESLKDLFVTCETMFFLGTTDQEPQTREIEELKQRLSYLSELTENVERTVYDAFRQG